MQGRPSEPDGFGDLVETRSNALLRSGWLLTGDWPSRHPPARRRNPGLVRKRPANPGRRVFSPVVSTFASGSELLAPDEGPTDQTLVRPGRAEPDFPQLTAASSPRSSGAGPVRRIAGLIVRSRPDS